MKIHAAAVNPVDTYIREGGHPLSRECPYTPGLDCGGEVIAVGKDVTEFQKGDRVFSCGSVSGTYATHGVFNADQLYPLPRHFTFQDGACIGTGYFTSLLYAHLCFLVRLIDLVPSSAQRISKIVAFTCMEAVVALAAVS